MKKSVIVFALFAGMLLPYASVQAQDFIKTATIEYERTQNIMATFDNDPRMQTYVEKTGSEIYKSFFTLTLLPEQSIYQFSKYNGKFNQFPEMPADINTIYYDSKDGQKIVLKNVNGKTYSVTGDDSKIQWKLTDEKRTVAGYECRRANGVLFDSIYVVAFFSDRFVNQVGPESFSGLPGLILSLSIPGEHIAWSAVKVTAAENLPKIEMPVQGEKTSIQDYKAMLEAKVRRIPKFGPVMYKRALL